MTRARSSARWIFAGSGNDHTVRRGARVLEHGAAHRDHQLGAGAGAADVRLAHDDQRLGAALGIRDADRGDATLAHARDRARRGLDVVRRDGTVHRAVDASTGQTVALKIVRAATDDERARFEREAAILAQLAHPGIVSYIGHGVAPDGACYVVMEWVTGTTPVVVSFATGADAFGRAVERAVQLLEDAVVEAAVAEPVGMIRIDAEAAGVLAAVFEVDRDRIGHRLGRERPTS